MKLPTQPVPKFRVSIVLPCLNGASYLPSSLRTLYAFLEAHTEEIGAYEILLVDDGSTDRTTELVEHGFPELRVIRHRENRGKGAAVRSGMRASTGEFVLFTDADLPYDLTAMLVMLDALDRKEFDICLGTRARGEPGDGPPRSLLRRIASTVYTEFVSRIVVTGVRDTQCGFKGFRADVARYLCSQGRIDNFAFDVELVYLAFKNDLDMKKVPVRLVGEEASTLSLLRHAPGMLLSVLKLPFLYYSGRYEIRRPVARLESQN